MSLPRCISGSAAVRGLHCGSFAAAIVILAIGCRDDVPPANQAVGPDVAPLASSARASTAPLGFSSYQIIEEQFTLAPGETLGAKTIICPSGTLIIGGGVNHLPSGILDYWIVSSYPGFNPDFGYGWSVFVQRSPGATTSNTLTAKAICAN
jgi:hypothetical protein